MEQEGALTDQTQEVASQDHSVKYPLVSSIKFHAGEENSPQPKESTTES
jgi:hypothetical protein